MELSADQIGAMRAIKSALDPNNILDSEGIKMITERTAIQAMTRGDTQRTMLAALRRLLKVTPVDTIAARRRIADATTERKGYVFV